jgi:putative transposase
MKENEHIMLYGFGRRFRDIRSYLKEMYNTEISGTLLSDLTEHDRGIPGIKEWRARGLPLEDMYYMIWANAWCGERQGSNCSPHHL